MTPNRSLEPTRVGKPPLAAQLLDRHAGLSLLQKPDDLLFGKSLLHVQSLMGLDSKR